MIYLSDYGPLTAELCRELADDPAWETAIGLLSQVAEAQPDARCRADARAEVRRSRKIQEVLRGAAMLVEQRDLQVERDRFARAALPVMAAATMRDRLDLSGRDMLFSAEEVAQRAFDIADAMLAESERRATPKPAEEQAGGST